MDKKGSRELRIGYTKSPNYTCLDDLDQIDDYNFMEAISLDYCGDEQCESGHKFGPYIRRNYVLHVIVSGFGNYVYHGVNYRMGAGHAFLVTPGIETVYYADKDEPWHYSWIGFHGYRSEEFIHNMGFTATKPVIDIKNPKLISNSILDILKYSTLMVTDELRRKGHLLETLALLTENNDDYLTGFNNRTVKNSKYVNMTIEYLRTHFNEKIHVDQIAKNIGITRSYLTHIFKDQIGISPQEFLINIRLTTASALLKKSDEPIYEVAISCGYDDSLAFSKAFKKKFGVSPKDYRKSDVKVVTTTKKDDYLINWPL